MAKRSLLAGVLAVITVFVAGPAFADDAQREDAFARGLGLQQTKQYASALEAFRNAYRTQPTPQSLLHIAECEIALGRLVKGQDHLQALVDATIVDGSPPEFFIAQAQGKVELAELTPRVRVGYITVRVPAGSPDGVVISLDGWTIGAAQLGVPQRVDPGPHVVVVAAQDHVPMTANILIGEGESFVSDAKVGVFAPAAKENHYPNAAYSAGLASAGTAVTVIGGVAVGVGVVGMLFSGLACFMRCSGAEGAEVFGVVAGAGLGVSLIGIPMIVVGNHRVASAKPHVAISPRGAQLDWAF